MKTLLKDGPLNGRIIDAKHNVFGYAIVTERIKQGQVVSRTAAVYEASPGSDQRHPCKKRGLVRVFIYSAERSAEESTLEELWKADR